jgi:hypothetical protein
MQSLFASGHIIDIVFLLVAVEIVLALAWRRRTGRGMGLSDLVLMLFPGVCLLAALRAALVGQAYGWIAAWLLVSLAAHLNDLVRRWSR